MTTGRTDAARLGRRFTAGRGINTVRPHGKSRSCLPIVRQRISRLPATDARGSCGCAHGGGLIAVVVRAPDSHSSSQLSIVDSTRGSIESRSGRRIIEQRPAANGCTRDSLAVSSTRGRIQSSHGCVRVVRALIIVGWFRVRWRIPATAS